MYTQKRASAPQYKSLQISENSALAIVRSSVIECVEKHDLTQVGQARTQSRGQSRHGASRWLSPSQLLG